VAGKVYVSYAWSVEREKGIVEKLEAACQARGIELLRDINQIRYGKSIREFMDQLSAGDHVVLVLSEQYFKSEHCMYELREIDSHSPDAAAFRQRVLPIVVEGTKIYEPIDRIPYLKHWEDKAAELEAGLSSLSRRRTTNLNASLDLYHEFRDNVDRLLGELVDINALTEPVHLETDFAALLDRIRPKEEPGKPTAITRNRKPDDHFQESLRAEVRALLETHAQLAAAIKDCIAKLPGQKDSGDWIAWLWEQPIEQVVDSVLRPAAMKVLTGANELSYESDWKQAKQLFYRLLMLSVDPQWVRQSENDERPGDLRFELIVHTPGGVEVASARYRQQTLELTFDPGTPDVYGPGAVKPPPFETGWNDGDAIQCLLTEVWNRVFPNRRTTHHLNPQQLKQLHKWLSDCEHFQMGHFYVPIDVANDGRWGRADLYDGLLKSLPSLTIISIRSGGDQSVLQVSDEAVFMVSVLGFLQIPELLRKGQSH